ncbi:unnamed protein product [Ilex paraguariensis]|uniref:WAT1-related protein n=1 Tax=Ilex paraguariensis TaxID=185542 RepID=A0ABC8R1E8_9AQUA
MKVEDAVPYVAMVIVQFALVGLMVESKKAMSDGMTNFTFAFYANAITAVILLPSSFLIHRSSTRPPLTFSLLGRFLLLGLIGFLVQIFGYAGIQYASASLSSAMLNLIPGFTFVLAIIFRMEKVDCRSASTMYKSIGTVVSITGALIVTLYDGPLILKTLHPHSKSLHLHTQHSDWLIGGLLLAIDSLISSVFIIAQALIIKNYPAELFIMFFYCCVVAILSAATSLILENDLSSWSLQSNTRLIAVIYSGLLGSAFQVTVGAWCLRRKGPLFVAMFHPLGVVIATAMGIIFLGDAFYLGSLLGSMVIVIGFYSVMWGKAKEGKLVEGGQKGLDSSNGKTPLLQTHVQEPPLVQ